MTLNISSRRYRGAVRFHLNLSSEVLKAIAFKPDSPTFAIAPVIRAVAQKIGMESADPCDFQYYLNAK